MTKYKINWRFVIMLELVSFITLLDGEPINAIVSLIAVWLLVVIVWYASNKGYMPYLQ
jgi:hypothetical protein